MNLRMGRIACVLALLVGCVAPSGRRDLDDMDGAMVEIRAEDARGWHAEAWYEMFIATPDCARFSTSLHASTPGGLTLISDPEPRTDGTCERAFTEGGFDRFPTPMEITIADPTDTWTIAFASPQNSAIEVIAPFSPGTTASLVWRDGPPINEVFLTIKTPGDYYELRTQLDPTVRITGNAVDIDVPWNMPADATIDVRLQADYTIAATTDGDKTLPICRGPASCKFTVVASYLQ